MATTGFFQLQFKKKKKKKKKKFFLKFSILIAGFVFCNWVFVMSTPLGGYVMASNEGEDEEEDFLSEEEVEHVFAPSGVDITLLLQTAANFKLPPPLDIKARYLYFTRYVPTFVGVQFCSWVVEKKFVASQAQAVALGQYLMDQRYIVAASGRNRAVFQNGWVLYRFAVAEEPELFHVLHTKERNALRKGKARHVKEQHTWLDLPVASFTVALGTSGVAGLWATMARDWPGYGLQIVAYVLALIAAVIWILCTVLYVGKILFRRKKFLGEWNSPIAMNLFPVWSMTILSLANTAVYVDLTLSEVLWWMGTPVQLLLALVIATRWMLNPRQLSEMTPHMFLPVVGLALIPIAGGPVGFSEIGYLFFGVSFIFWIVLFTLLWHRLFFLGSLPPKLVPSMFLAIAPPSLMGLAYYSLAGELGAPGRILYGAALFFLLLLFCFRLSLTSTPFSMAWWGYTFPFAAFCSFTARYHQALSLASTGGVGSIPAFVLLILTAVLANFAWVSVSVFTVVYIIRRRLFFPTGKCLLFLFRFNTHFHTGSRHYGALQR
jgi:tellurite resistance protein